MKKSKGVAILLAVLLVLAGLSYYASIILSSTGNGEDKHFKLGLDLAGGVSITYQVESENPTSEQMKDTIYKLQKRVEGYSTEASVYQEGDDRITVEIPGVKDANKILDELGKPGSLEFRDPDGNVYMTGNDVKDAQAATQQDNLGNKQYVVQLTLTDEGAQKFADATTANVGKVCPIVYDDEAISTPRVKEAITGGSAVIDGMSSYEEAETLASNIRIGSLSLELSELQSQIVAAQLGTEAISTALKAAAIGLALIAVFMIAYYWISGVAATIALGINTTMVVAVIYLLEITLTLPGIAGIILGIGMAVDANVIVFARIREEIAGGKSVLAAVNEGYKKALSAILDGQVTTFIAALVLMVLGSGTVKGFAYTLMISIILSLFTALFIAKYLTRAFYGVGVRAEKFYGKAKKRKVIRFVQNRVKYFVISGVVILAGIGGMIYFGATSGNALNYSLEFVGGTSTTADFGKDYTAAEVEKDIVPSVSKLHGNSAAQVTTVHGSHDVTLKTRTLSLDERQDLAALLEKDFNVDASTIETQSISSTISGEMRTNAVKAVIISCIFMLLYIWFRFKDIRFASSAILALVHDVLVVVTAYALIRISVGSTFIACILTIVGYSVNDTIVIFDRIRENLHGIKKYSADELADIANESLTQTLSRSINTSLTTFVMVLLLFIFGHTSIREFSLPLMVGVLCGTYSSICIATELWYVMKLYLGKSAIKKQAAAPAKVSKKAKN